MISLKTLASLFFLWGTWAGPSDPGQGLEQCFSAALKRSELIATQKELIEQAEQRYAQAKSTIFPTISGSVSYLTQEASPSGTGSSLSPADQTTAKIVAVQPLFRGLREFATILQRNLQVTAQMSARRQAAAQLYSDIATNFYAILSIEQMIRNFESQVGVYNERIAELRKRIDIGRSKESEALTVRSSVDALMAQIEQLRGQLGAAREAFAFLTGFPSDMPLRESESLGEKPETLSFYLNRIDKRPDVRAARDSLSAIEKNVRIARAGHFPSLDLQGDYYFSRPGVLQDQRWDVLVTATIPIFAGGFVAAQMREASSQVRQNELSLTRARRLADQEIRTNFLNVQADIKQIDRLDQSSRSALKSYKAQASDYRLGRVTNLDVLQAIAASEDAKRALDNARYQTKLDRLKLETAAAMRPLGNKEDFDYE